MADHYLPPEIVYDILSRTPIKSLARFRCVCKSWLEYINDPYLETIHVKEELMPIMFQKLHPHKINKQCKISFLRPIQGTSFVKKHPVWRFCCKEYSTPKDLVLGSCNGLTLVCYNKDLCHGTYCALINPITKQRYNLPPVKIRFGNVNRLYPVDTAGIGFDDSTSSLKTVSVLSKEVLVNALDINVVRRQLCTVLHSPGMRSWRKIDNVPAYPTSGAGVFAHGRLHWLVDSHWWSLEDGTKVVWFDVKREEFGLLDPPEREGGYWIDDQLVDLNGEVGFAYIDKGIELWILKQEEWVLHCRFDLYPPPYYYYSVVVLGCWNKDGDVLFSSNRGKRLFLYTLKTKVLRQVYRGDRCEAHMLMYRNSWFSIRTSAYSYG